MIIKIFTCLMHDFTHLGRADGWLGWTLLWNAKRFSLLVENNYLVWFRYTDFHILINPFTANPVNWQICAGYILARSASSPDTQWGDNRPDTMKNDLFLPISTIILPKVLNLLYFLQPQKFAVIYWNLYQVLKCYIENLIDISQLYKSICCSVARPTCIIFYFTLDVCKWTFL